MELVNQASSRPAEALKNKHVLAGPQWSLARLLCAYRICDFQSAGNEPCEM